MRWFQRFFRRKLAEKRLDAELRFHLDQRAADLTAGGMALEEARRRARLEFGGLDQVKEECRDVGGSHILETFVQDLRYGLRQLRRNPGFSVGATLSLALGIGATTAIFSLVYAVLVDPFPYKDANRIVYVQLHGKNPGYGPFRANGNEFKDVRNVPSVEDVFFQQPPHLKNVSNEDSRMVVSAGLYSTNFFHFMGVQPLLGRVFTPADAPGGRPEPVAVLSYHLWREHYAGSREILAKTIQLDDSPYMVIGVMPPRFTWLGGIDLYLPGAPTADPHDYWMAFPKLKPGANPRAAEAEFQVLVYRFAKGDPNDYPQGSRVKVVSLYDEALGSSGSVIADLFAAAVILLIIGCANVSILLLARGTARQREFAVRTSMGAGRGRLIRQLLTESVLLSVAGATLGILAAYWAVNAMPRFLSYLSLPREVAIQLNVPVLLFSAMVAVITGALFGLSPALELSRPRAGSLLQASSMRVMGGARVRRMHRLPIAGQVALAMLLVAGAEGAAKAFIEKLHTVKGFDPDHVFSVVLSMPEAATPTTLQRVQEMEAGRNAVAQTPGVSEAGFSILWWPGESAPVLKIEIQSNPTLGDAQAVFAPISPQLLPVLRVPLLQGRTFDTVEVRRQARVAMVNQAFVKRFLGNLDPIGQSVRIPDLKKFRWDSSLSGKGPDDWMEVIGVVGDATNDDLDQPLVRPAIFIPYTYFPIPSGTLFARASGDPVTAIRSVEAKLRQSDPDLIVTQAHTLQEALEWYGWGRERLIAESLGFYASIALILAAGGLFGVVSFAVTQRTQELGIRMALGAGRGSVVRVVLGSTAAMVGVGVAAGFITSAILGPVISSWGGVSLSKSMTLLVSALILVLVATVACAIPAWRATKVDPMAALRYE